MSLLIERLIRALETGTPLPTAFNEDEIQHLQASGICVMFTGDRPRVGVKPSKRRALLRLRRPVIVWGFTDE